MLSILALNDQASEAAGKKHQEEQEKQVGQKYIPLKRQYEPPIVKVRGGPEVTLGPGVDLRWT